MKWLLTTSGNIDETVVAEWLQRWGCPMQTISPPIPMGDDEKVFQVVGPKELRDKIRSVPGLLTIHRQSDPVPY